MKAYVGALRDRSSWLAGVQHAYLPWDEFRHRPAPPGLSREDAWAVVQLDRLRAGRELPLRGVGGTPWRLWMTDGIVDQVLRMERTARDPLSVGPPRAPLPEGTEAFRLAALREEAIWSSLIEGAATTRRVAAEMLESRRAPRDKGEQMIVNNYQTIEWLRRRLREPLSVDLIREAHARMTEGTLSDPRDAGRVQEPGEDRVSVMDAEGVLRHQPPAAEELPERLQTLCDFANSEEVFPPTLLRGSLLHFQLAHDHPFVDGNGRTARALFYWLMLKDGHELASYLTISQVIARSRAAYGRAFLHSEHEGDVTHFVLYHMGLYQEAIEDLHRYVARRHEERLAAEDRLAAWPALNGRQRQLLRHALEHPQRDYTANVHASKHAVTLQTALTDLRRVEQLGLLRATRRGKTFYFRAVPDLDDRVRRGPHA